MEQAVTDHLVHVAQEAVELDRPVHRAHLQEVQLITAAVAQAGEPAEALGLLDELVATDAVAT